MYNAILQFFLSRNMQETSASGLAYVLTLIVVVSLCIAATAVIRRISVTIATRSAEKTKFTWDNILLRNRFIHRLSHMMVPIILTVFAGSFPGYESLISRVIRVYTIVVAVIIGDAALNSADEIYRGFAISKVRPIRGFIQVIKVVLYIIGIVLGIAALIGESPVVLLGGIGALTAVISLIFKDAILGFVAGIQLTSNDMIRIGDWIEMPKYYADGTVIDLSMTTVKVRNFDNTITAIPAYALVSDAFINWRGMEGSGGRRIKRSIYIDAQSVHLCTDEMLERFRKIERIRGYIDSRQEEIKQFNREQNADMSEPINGKGLSNLGVFRAYATAYLQHHPSIHMEMAILVRQLQASGRGIPVEVYAFTNTVKWDEYEGIQADIFDHLFAAIPRFGLRVFQQPSGQDIQSAFPK